jgi:hypothetical protein
MVCRQRHGIKKNIPKNIPKVYAASWAYKFKLTSCLTELAKAL